MAYYDKMRNEMLSNSSPQVIMEMMKHGGGCGWGKKMPKYSNNPRTIQGRQLRRGGSMKCGGYKMR